MAQDEPRPSLADLTQYHWRNRLLLLFAASDGDVSYRTTKTELDQGAAGVADRDLAVFEVFGRGKSFVDGHAISDEEADMLRQRFSAPAGRFLVILVGKDGTVKRRSEDRIPLGTIFDQIDSMPMRQREMRERRGES